MENIKNPSVLYPQISTFIWAKRYNLSIKSKTCVKCGLELTTTKPFASGKWRGLISEEHECGQSYDILVAIELDDKGKNIWQSVYNNIKAIYFI